MASSPWPRKMDLLSVYCFISMERDLIKPTMKKYNLSDIFLTSKVTTMSRPFLNNTKNLNRQNIRKVVCQNLHQNPPCQSRRHKRKAPPREPQSRSPRTRRLRHQRSRELLSRPLLPLICFDEFQTQSCQNVDRVRLGKFWSYYRRHGYGLVIFSSFI